MGRGEKGIQERRERVSEEGKQEEKGRKMKRKERSGRREGGWEDGDGVQGEGKRERTGRERVKKEEDRMEEEEKKEEWGGRRLSRFFQAFSPLPLSSKILCPLKTHAQTFIHACMHMCSQAHTYTRTYPLPFSFSSLNKSFVTLDG